MPDKTTYHNIIDGQIQASASGAMMDIINPSTGEVYATAPNSDAQDVDLACRAAGRRPSRPGAGPLRASGSGRCSSSPT